jgi:hypothetical protein
MPPLFLGCRSYSLLYAAFVLRFSVFVIYNYMPPRFSDVRSCCLRIETAHFRMLTAHLRMLTAHFRLLTAHLRMLTAHLRMLTALI